MLAFQQRKRLGLGELFHSRKVLRPYGGRVVNVYLPVSPSDWRGLIVLLRVGGWAIDPDFLYRTHIPETVERIFSIWNHLELFTTVVVQRHGRSPTCAIWACPWDKNFKYDSSGVQTLAERISLKPFDAGFLRSKFCGIGFVNYTDLLWWK